MTITGTTDGTMVNVKLASTGHAIGGTGITDTPGGGTVTFMLNAGDVAELVGDPTGDFGG